jgi:hypothetical protein
VEQAPPCGPAPHRPGSGSSTRPAGGRVPAPAPRQSRSSGWASGKDGRRSTYVHASCGDEVTVRFERRRRSPLPPRLRRGCLWRAVGPGPAARLRCRPAAPRHSVPLLRRAPRPSPSHGVEPRADELPTTNSTSGHNGAASTVRLLEAIARRLLVDASCSGPRSSPAAPELPSTVALRTDARHGTHASRAPCRDAVSQHASPGGQRPAALPGPPSTRLRQCSERDDAGWAPAPAFAWVENRHERRRKRCRGANAGSASAPPAIQKRAPPNIQKRGRFIGMPTRRGNSSGHCRCSTNER